MTFDIVLYPLMSMVLFLIKLIEMFSII